MLSGGISLLIIFLFGAVSLWIAIGGYMRHRKESLLVADRNLGTGTMALSIAATWIWAPAVFLASQKGYEQGAAGAFWFIVPNIACLILFGWFISHFIKKIPEGYTLSAWMRMQKSPRVQGAYIVQNLGLIVCSIAVQLLAGAVVITALTGLNYYFVCLLMAGVTIIYSMIGGIRASVGTDKLQMILLLAIGVPITLFVIKAAGWDMVVAGLGGYSGQFTNVLTPSVILAFGIPVTIGLLAGPFGDQTFYQRAFAQKPGNIFKSYVWGAIIFALVPLSFMFLGFVMAGAQVEIGNTQMTNILAVGQYLPEYAVYLFLVVILAGLLTTLDSMYAAAGSIFGYDLSGRKENRKNARLGMLAVGVAGITLAFIPDMKILYLFLFYGTLRASTLLPTILTFFGKTWEKGMFWGIITSLCVGLPIFAIGNFGKITPLIILGSLLTVGISGVMSITLKGGDTGAKTVNLQSSIQGTSDVRGGSK